MLPLNRNFEFQSNINLNLKQIIYFVKNCVIFTFRKKNIIIKLNKIKKHYQLINNKIFVVNFKNMKICNNCQKEVENEVQFCENCGYHFDLIIQMEDKTDKSAVIENQNKADKKEIKPADQAAMIIDKTKIKTSQICTHIFKLWKDMLVPERLTIIGSILGVLSIFFLEISFSIYFVFFLLIIILPLIITYFSQGASGSSKIKLVRWNIVIGSFFFSESITVLIIFDQAKKALGYFGGFVPDSPAFGLYALIISSALIIYGSFKIQSTLLKK